MEPGKENVPATRSRSSYWPSLDCVLCGQTVAVSNPKHAKSTGGIVKIRSIHTKSSLHVLANKRDDSWGHEVTCRLEAVLDHKTTMQMKYHRNCYKSFCNVKRNNPFSPPLSTVSSGPSQHTPSPPASQRPRFSTSTTTPGPPPRPVAASTPRPAALHQGNPLAAHNVRPRPGRPVDLNKSEAFEHVCEHLEDNPNIQHDIGDLQKLMSKFSPGCEYTTKTLRSKLLQRYGDDVTILPCPKNTAVVTFSRCAREIVTSTFKDRKADTTDKAVLDAAVKVILKDIDAMPKTSDNFPSVTDMETGGKHLIPESLLHLLTGIICPGKRGQQEKYDRKCVALANIIIAAARPIKFVSPLLLGLALHIHRSYGAKELINILSSLGMCASYGDATRMEDAIVFSAPPRVDPGAFIQFSFDNVDYNVRTLDGLRTWHCMGGVRSVTPASGVGCDPVLPRSSTWRTAQDRGAFGTIPVKVCRYVRNQGLKSVAVPDCSADMACLHPIVHAARSLDYLWLLGTVLRNEASPGWSGYMELCTKHLPFQTSAVLPLPFVNLDPNNHNAIYTALDFAISEALRHGQRHCFVTFDQPLFWKATDIIFQAESSSPMRQIFVRLGGFHLLMSYLGCIGYIMGGSGLEAILELVYAKNTVPYIISGHAYARSIRAHYLLQMVVVRLILETYRSYFERKTVNCRAIARLYEERMQSDSSSAEQYAEIDKFLAALGDLPNEMDIGRTGMLWFQYVKLVDFLHLHIRSERSGNWELHVASIQLMLPAFPAAGHLNYAKSAPLYLSIVRSMKEALTQEEYDTFTSNFAIRRSNKFFAGLPSDLTIEQVLMAALKGQGGLTRGRGMTDATIATFVRTMPLCTRISRGVKSFAGCLAPDTMQHTDLRTARMRRDRSDSGKMFEWLRAHSPFNKPKQHLVSLSTGLVGDDSINCDSALEIGARLVQQMAGRNFGDMTLKRNDRVLSLKAIDSSIKVNNSVEPINATQLFHRIIILNLPDVELSTCFEFELAPRPASLFDSAGMRKSQKSALIKILDELSTPSNEVPAFPAFVFDGGHLLHHVLWPRPATFGDIAVAYKNHILSFVAKYKGTATVVFDGYAAGPSTKDPEHQRRLLRSSADVVFDELTPTTTTQGAFLTNSANKERLITLVTTTLRAADIQVSQARGDADRDIVVTAISYAQQGKNSVIVGEDTDLLVLMISLTPRDSNVSLLNSSSVRGVTVRRSNALQEVLGSTADHVLFFHAVMGCDTTSALFKRSRKLCFNKLKGSPTLQKIVSVFNSEQSTIADITAAGEKFLLHAYGFPTTDDLNKARFLQYKKTISRQPIYAKFEPAILPPTRGAAREHCARVYHQVQAWRGNNLDPTLWGWRKIANQLHPTLTLDPPAPARLLKLILCNCKGACSTNLCECRRSGLLCSSLCGQCSGVGCRNAAPPEETATDSEDIDNPEESAEVK